jgi:hypothetical protein
MRGGHVVNTVMHRPELVRSWASDVVGLFDPDYVWHDMAQVWQTPGDGEELVNTMLDGTVEDRAERMCALGIPPNIATSIAGAQGPEMGRAILSLYRSARQPAMAEAGRELEKAAARPGLSLLATEDPYIGLAENRRRAADRAGARTEVLDGLGHWWMTQDPARGAAVSRDSGRRSASPASHAASQQPHQHRRAGHDMALEAMAHVISRWR